MQNILNYESIKQEYLGGSNLTKLQNKYKIDRHTIASALKKDGVDIRCGTRKYFHNYNIFEKVDTEEKAYWLGFLYADGGVAFTARHKSVRLTSSIKDKEHIIKFRDFISPSVPVKILKDRIRETGIFQYCVVDVNDKKITADLIKLGCIPKKTCILTFPTENQVPCNLINHFVRGYFDGDGSVYTLYADNVLNFTFTGTKEFLKKLQCILSAEISEYANTSIKILKEYRTDKVFRIQKGGANITKGFFDYLYKDATIYLPRKKEKFVNFFAARLRNQSMKIAEKSWDPESNSMGIRGEGIRDYQI